MSNKKRVLIGSPVHQKPTILKEFLNSLSSLKQTNTNVDYCFIDDNEFVSSRQLLKQFSQTHKNTTIHPSPRTDKYICNEITHQWSESLIWKVAGFKNLIIKKAIKDKYEYLFLVDSDLVLHPQTLEQLIRLDKDIISEIHWTQWQPNTINLPQVWLSDHYTLFHKGREEAISQEEAYNRQIQFIQKLEKPGVYEVGGLCACTLISQKALLAGVNFNEIKNVSFWGEDRHFCIRAAALGFSLFVDTHFPSYHIYRESDLQGLEQFKQKNGLSSAVSFVNAPSEIPLKQTLSLCMIVKNEIENLPRCLSSAKPYVDEIIIIDTGSDDGTPELAANYGANVSYFEWCDDFAAARNYAISQASGDWILMLDADDELVIESDNFKEEITQNPETIAYSLTYIEVDDQAKMTPLHRLSLFRNLPNLRYVGRFHEFLSDLNPDQKLTQISHLNSLNVLHHGYSQENVQHKDRHRNIPMLERIRQQEGLSLKLLFCLAEMYADTQQPEKAQDCYTAAFDRLLPNLIEETPPEDLGFVPVIVFTLGMRSLDQTDYETVRLLCQRGLEWCPNYPPLNFLAGLTLKGLGFPLGAIAYFEICLRLGRENSYNQGQPFEVNYITTYPAYELGCAYLELNNTQKALAAFELVLAFDPNYTQAQAQIDKIRHDLYPK